MLNFLETVASFVLVLGILVFVHEFGHFLSAKWFRIGVPVFSFGFGPRLIGVRRKETDYRVSAIPLGGYVRLAGDESDEARSGAPEEFLSRPRHQRLAVFLGGPVFNVLLALAVTWALLWVYGRDEVPTPKTYPYVAKVLQGSTAAAAGIRVGDQIVSINGEDARIPKTQLDEILLSPATKKPVVLERNGKPMTVTLDTGMDPRHHLGDPGWALVEENPGHPVIDMVMSGYPAAKAGLEAGDIVRGAEGTSPIDEIHLRALITASAGREVPLQIERGGKLLDVVVVPRKEGGGGVIGVIFRTAGQFHRTFGPLDAAAESVKVNVELSGMLFTTLDRLVKGKIGVRAFSGPIEIARVSKEAVKALQSFLAFLALISLQLGILNLLPIPGLDGGHIMILAVEAVLRRDLSQKIKERVIQAGLLFLIAFFAVVIYFDILKTWFPS